MPKAPIVLNVPSPMISVNHWLIMGLDPSLSCTGYAFMHVTPNAASKTSTAEWLEVGSVKPQETKNPVWLRSKLMAQFLKQTLDSVSLEVLRDNGVEFGAVTLGLMVVMEAPTPTDDFLNRVNAIFHEHIFSDGDLCRRFEQIRILTINASTLRSLMGLYTKGNNKGENIKRAYTFLDQAKYPNLDGDACDAVMLTMVARAASSILLGMPNEVQPKFLQTLCDASPVERGKGRNVRITTKGLLHTTGQRPEYWYSYNRQDYTVQVRDASQPKKQLTRLDYSV
jgi:hypothetical protein